jgi:hypothetical protein
MPFRVPSLLYVVIGLIVAFLNDYFDSLGTVGRILTAILAVLLWPLLLLGFDVQVSR